MARGGHFGLWKQIPARDMFRSRWKRFYKRCTRERATQGNNPDRPGPHKGPANNPDTVPEPWRLLYSTTNFEEENYPRDTVAENLMKAATNKFMLPAMRCDSPIGRHAILRTLDGGRRGLGGDSGFGRMETSALPSDLAQSHLPLHIRNVLKANAIRETRRDIRGQPDEIDEGDDPSANPNRSRSDGGSSSGAKDYGGGGGGRDAAQDFYSKLMSAGDPRSAHQMFPVRRLQELMEEEFIVWRNGLNKPPEQDASEDLRGHFPYIEEQASLVAELPLKKILEKTHRTKLRRHPKWQAITDEYKKGRAAYERRKEMNKAEAKAKMGVLRQVLAE